MKTDCKKCQFLIPRCVKFAWLWLYRSRMRLWRQKGNMGEVNEQNYYFSIKYFYREGRTFAWRYVLSEGRSYSGDYVCCELVLRLVQAALHIWSGFTHHWARIHTSNDGSADTGTEICFCCAECIFILTVCRPKHVCIVFVAEKETEGSFCFLYFESLYLMISFVQMMRPMLWASISVTLGDNSDVCCSVGVVK